ncbi:MAG: hypothetical protein OCD76_00370 [Reichenbachiella sp.]
MKPNAYLLFTAITFLSACGEQDYEWDYSTEVTYINETADTIFMSGNRCEFENILPKSTAFFEYVLPHAGTKKSDKPDINNVEPFVTCGFFYGSSDNCERNANDKESQEDWVQKGDFEFAYTFRFTQERADAATPCR